MGGWGVFSKVWGKGGGFKGEGAPGCEEGACGGTRVDDYD